MSDIGDDIGKQFEAFRLQTEKALQKLPLLVANDAKNFFLDRFRQSNWVDTTSQSWKKRQPGAKRNSRALLVDTGRGKRSIRVIKSQWGNVSVGIDDAAVSAYMSAHNEGFRGRVNVAEYSRTATRKVSTRYSSTGRALKTGQKKIRGKGHQVAAHTRNVNLPRRRFIGNSAALNSKLQRLILSQLAKL